MSTAPDRRRPRRPPPPTAPRASRRTRAVPRRARAGRPGERRRRRRGCRAGSASAPGNGAAGPPRPPSRGRAEAPRASPRAAARRSSRSRARSPRGTAPPAPRAARSRTAAARAPRRRTEPLHGPGRPRVATRANTAASTTLPPIQCRALDRHRPASASASAASAGQSATSSSSSRPVMSRMAAAMRYADCPASSSTVTSVTCIVEVRISAAYTATVATITASTHADQQRAAQEPPRARGVTVAQVGPRDARDAVAPRPAHHEAAEHEGGLDRVDRGHQRQCDERRDGVEDAAEVEPARRRRAAQRGRLGAARRPAR